MDKEWEINQAPTWYFVLGLLLLPIACCNLVSECHGTCSSRVAIISTDIIECDLSCRNRSCRTGCNSWDNSTLEECYAVCNDTHFSEQYTVQYCQSGCLIAEDEYASDVADEVGEPSAPEASSIEATSLTLTWAAASNSAIRYLVEWRFVAGGGGAWSYYGSSQPISETSLALTGLIPYAVYQFRILWVITPRHVLTSPESRDVLTLASGVPSTAPMITSVSSSSPSTISITWDPPPFPNGPITGYTIRVENFLNQPAVVRSVDALTREETVVDSSFQASTLYRVLVSASNMEGIGPSGEMNITSGVVLNVTGTVPYLVVGVTSLSIKTGTTEVSTVSFVEFGKLGTLDPLPNDVHTIDRENVTIQDVAVHYWKNLVFICDSEGRIHRRTINPSNLTLASSQLLYINANPIPTKLDVDWLNDRLFFVQGTEIYQCDLNVSQCAVAVATNGSTLVEMKVDPYIGYLYWSELNSGIRRLPLASLTSGFESLDVNPLIRLSGASVFAINTDSFQIIFTNSTGNSMQAAALDGSQVTTLKKAESADVFNFVNTTSLVYFNHSLTWTHTGDSHASLCLGLYTYTKEELYYESDSNAVSNAGLFICVDGYHGLDMFYPTYQPIPVPSSPPTSLQVLFTSSTADISWTKPQSVPGKGAGAWEEWEYEVTITDLGTGDEVKLKNIRDVSVVAENLQANSEYAVHVTAYSEGGFGPHSKTFSGTTLINVDVQPYLLLANETNLWTSQLDGSLEETLLMTLSSVRDIDWYQGYYIWSTTSGDLYRLAEGSRDPQQLSIDLPDSRSSVRAIAVDWLSEVLYWADEDQNQIIRGQLSDNSSSSVASPTVIKYFAGYVQDLAIDSVQAYLYWTTTKSVECSRLNGESPLVFYETEDLSLDAVAGLTVDFDSGYLYWFLVLRQNSEEELKVFRAGLAGLSDPPPRAEEIGEVLSATTNIALHFYSSKLFWINSESRVVVSDSLGQREALLPGSDVETFTIVQDTLKPLPDGFIVTPNVIASEIPPSSILVSGTWDNFNITWHASPEVTYGIVFYTVTVFPVLGPTTLQDAFITIQDLEPFQSLEVTVQPYTYWARAAATTVQVMSPMSVPTVPLNPRAFGLEDQDIMTGITEYSAEFRWLPPEQINGILLGYKISWGTSLQQLAVIKVNASDVTLSYTFPSLMANTTYHFQIEAFGEVGSGPATDPINIITGVSAPPPTILESRGSGVTLTDTDTGVSTDLLGGVQVSAIAYIARSHSVFYIESTGDIEIYESDLDGSFINEVVELQSHERPTQSNFIINWITQTLYWSDNTAIYSFDTTLSSALANVQTVYMSQAGGTVGGIGLSPFRRSLVWTETIQSTSVLMISDLNGENARPLFETSSRRRRSSANCTCSSRLSPGMAIYVDSSDPDSPSVFLVNAILNDLWVSDIEGCHCRLLVNGSSQVNSGLPPDSLSADSNRVYWSNSEQGIVASVDKVTGADFQSEQKDVDFVLTYGTSLQHYPGVRCLAPSDYTHPTQLALSLSTRLTLTFEPVVQCPEIATAATTYTVHYARVETESTDLNYSCNILTCATMHTIGINVTLDSLDAYSFYLTQVSVTNVYSMGTATLGPVAIHRTSPGVPSPAQDVTVELLTPSEVNVSWAIPLEINGPQNELQFRVLYSTESQNSRTGFGDAIATVSGRYSVLVQDLSAATQYTFTVESYQSSIPKDMYSSSNTQDETTFQTPAQVEYVGKSSSSLSVSWVAPSDGSALQHWIRFREPFGKWQDALVGNTVSGAQYNVTIGEGNTAPLRPYTSYEVRTDLLYISGLEYVYTGEEDVLIEQTNASGPGAPGIPTVTETGTSTETFVVQWTAPAANGPGALQYTLEVRASSTGSWDIVYQGPKTSWIIVDLPTGDTYQFQVKAENDLFEGPYSPTSDEASLPNPAGDSTIFIIIGTVVGVLVIIAVVIIVLVCRQRRNDSKWPGEGPFREDVELAQLRNYPNMLIRQDNANYAVTHDGKEVLLPIFPRECLKLITFLGSGAFGEVFEGSALDILGNGSGETRVAVKTLRKGATDQEKQEFLKEATIMGKFKHPNIVSLMGVCLDNDPQYIILELMEGGDLLSYIRTARGPTSGSSKISLLDQIEIIYDVSKGCEYLEELHFVHRDIAARNCLVSTKSYDSHIRVVKIGDFGLARDIYKNDYYRKEGEGLLPVRWMSPEGLMDGYFSIQSDVWAFGVLIWEVMSRGQQPYPARSNVEVLRFVEAGGRLNQPENCPDDMYHIMRKCWEKLTEDRPSFKMLKEMIYDIRRKSDKPRGQDNFGFDGEGKVNYSHLKQDIPPELEDYLLPMDSKGDIKKHVTVELPPDIDYDLAEKAFEEDSKKDKRKGSKKSKDSTRSPFSSLRGRLPGARGEATRPHLEAALQDLANNKDKGKDIDERYLKYPVGSISKATGSKMAAETHTPHSAQDTMSGVHVGPSSFQNADPEGELDHAHYRTDQPDYEQPRKRHPNPFRANSVEELDGYDNIAFSPSTPTDDLGGYDNVAFGARGAVGGISTTDYTNV